MHSVSGCAESSSLDNLQEKAEWLQGDMKAQVDAGQLTAVEKTMLIEQAQTRHAEVSANVAEATEAGQDKRIAKMTAALDGLNVRTEKLRAVEPVKHKLKHQSAMKKLRKELAVLDASFDPGRPMKMEKVQAQLDELETDAAEWFNDDDGRLAAIARSAQKEVDKAGAAAAAEAAQWTPAVSKKKKK